MEAWPVASFVLVSLAVWRVTHLLAEEDGPFDAVVRLRARLGDGIVGRAMDCFYCLSLWIAAPFAALLANDALTWAVTWLALSGAACLLQRATQSAEAAESPIVQRSESDVVLRSEATSLSQPGRRDAATASAARASQSDVDHVPRSIDVRR